MKPNPNPNPNRTDREAVFSDRISLSILDMTGSGMGMTLMASVTNR